MADFAARQAPAGTTSTTWNDGDGSHEVKIRDGVFKPKNASEEAHAVNLGWPTTDAPKPARPKRAANRQAAKPKPQPQPEAAPEPNPSASDESKETVA